MSGMKGKIVIDRKKIILIWLMVVSVCLSQGDVHGQSIAETDIKSITTVVKPNPAENGSTVLLEVDTRAFANSVFGLSARFREKVIPVFQHPLKESGIYIGLVGVSYHSKPGDDKILLEWTTTDGYHSMPINIEVIRGTYKQEKLRVPKRKVNPSKTDLNRITRDRKELSAVYAVGHQARLWTKPFHRPTEGKITSPYGTRRILNGKLKSYHNGVDFRAPTGTPIYAVNDGIVRFTKKLFYSGNHVIIDHGMGVYTTYSHLSQISVKPDQFIERGQQIGLSGSTGRSNGPHLHLGAKINGVTVNPLQMMKILQPLVTTDVQVAAKKKRDGIISE